MIKKILVQSSMVRHDAICVTMDHASTFRQASVQSVRKMTK
ncbi:MULTISPECIES: hypothetical protein [unclassified Sporosarcina]|nr:MULTISPECIES: hypothetical protein [unclassified Sporosarcina]